MDVFAGGAALYFLRPPAEVAVINEINGDLVNMYRVVKHHLEQFVQQFKWALSSREMFKWLKDPPAETLTDVQRAARFYYLQHQCFGGKIQSQSWGTDTHAPPVNLLRIEEQLSAARLRLTGTYVERLEWRQCIKRHDRPQPSSTWTRRIGRRRATGCRSRLPNTRPWPRCCGGSEARRS